MTNNFQFLAVQVGVVRIRNPPCYIINTPFALTLLSLRSYILVKFPSLMSVRRFKDYVFNNMFGYSSGYFVPANGNVDNKKT